MEIWLGLAMFAALIACLAIGIPVAFSLFGVAIVSLLLVGGGFDALGWSPRRCGARSPASR